MAEISYYIVKHIDFLEQGAKPLESKLEDILKHEYRRKLSRYHSTDRILRKKYQMDFEAFEEQGMVERLNYSLEVETDADDWEMALDGISTMTRQLNELKEGAHVD